jgi:hypothetical protein
LIKPVRHPRELPRLVSAIPRWSGSTSTVSKGVGMLTWLGRTRASAGGLECPCAGSSRR